MPPTRFGKVLLSVVLFGLLMESPCMCREAQKNFRIGLAPIRVASVQERSFMGKGVESVISSRLSVKDRISIVGREDSALAFEKAGNAYTQEILQKTGKTIHADYLLWGTIQEEKEIFQVQFRMIDMSNGKEAFDFKKNDVTLDQVIPLASWISEKIKQKVLKEAALPGQAATALKVEGDERHAHPDSLIPADHEKARSR